MSTNRHPVQMAGAILLALHRRDIPTFRQLVQNATPPTVVALANLALSELSRELDDPTPALIALAGENRGTRDRAMSGQHDSTEGEDE